MHNDDDAIVLSSSGEDESIPKPQQPRGKKKKRSKPVSACHIDSSESDADDDYSTRMTPTKSTRKAVVQSSSTKKMQRKTKKTEKDLENTGDSSTRSDEEEKGGESKPSRQSKRVAQSSAKKEKERAQRRKQKRRKTLDTSLDGLNRGCGNNDLDDFIEDDDHVSYDEQEGDGEDSETSDDETQDEASDDMQLKIHRMNSQTRDLEDWLPIYLEYLAVGLMKEAFGMEVQTSVIQDMEYRNAADHIERTLCGKRDAEQSGQKWPDMIRYALKALPYYQSEFTDTERTCDVCGKQNHQAKVTVSGVPYEATTFYHQPNVISKSYSKEQSNAGTWKEYTFYAGNTCFLRTLTYSELMHARKIWVDIIQRKLLDNRDLDTIRNKTFLEREKTRFKGLTNTSVGSALRSSDTWQSSVGIGKFWSNVMKKAAVQYGRKASEVEKLSFPSAFLEKQTSESAMEEEKDIEAIENTAKENSVDNPHALDSDSDENADDKSSQPKRSRRTRGKPIAYCDNSQSEDEDYRSYAFQDTSPSKTSDKKHQTRSSGRKTVEIDRSKNQIDTEQQWQEQAREDQYCSDDDLEIVSPESIGSGETCLLCNKRRMNGGVVHGNYVHIISCYKCASKMLENGQNCLVCNRKIERVLNILPLSSFSRQMITKTRESTEYFPNFKSS